MVGGRLSFAVHCIDPFDFAQGRLCAAKDAAQDDKKD